LRLKAGVDYWNWPAVADEMAASLQDLEELTAVELVELQIWVEVQKVA